MTGLRIHYCPRCELRFTSSSEMEQHLRDDHRPPPETHEPDAVTASEPMSAPQSQQHDMTGEDGAAPSRPRISKWALALTGLGLIIAVLVAWLAPVATSVITAALIAAVIGCYWWRAHIRASLARPTAPQLASDTVWWSTDTSPRQ